MDRPVDLNSRLFFCSPPCPCWSVLERVWRILI